METPRTTSILRIAASIAQQRPITCASLLLFYGKVLLFMSRTGSISAHEHWSFHILYMLLWFGMSSIPFVFSLALSARVAEWWSWIVSALLAAFLCCDLMYYRAFSMYLSLYTAGQIDNLQGLGGAIVSMLRLSDIVFFIDLPITAFFLLHTRRAADRKTSPAVKALPLPAFALLVLIVLGVATANEMHARYRDNPLFYTCFVQNETMHKLSPLGFHAWDALEYWRDNETAAPTADERAEIETMLKKHHEVGDSSLLRGRFRGFNLLVIQVESLEECVIGQRVEGQEICPRLNALRSHALWFSNYYEQVANGTSSDADLMTNTGLYPPRKGCTFFRFPHNRYPSLPDILSEEGYTSVAMKADKATYYNWRDAFQHLGFSRCIDADSFAQSDMIGGMQSDSSVLFQDLSFIRPLRAPWYVFTVTETMHTPFVIPSEKQTLRLSPAMQQTVVGSYSQAVHYTDQHLGAMLDSMEAHHLLDSTLVVIYGDHCSLHKYYNDRLNESCLTEDWMHDAQPKIPLIIYHKSLQGEECTVLGGQVDLMQTVCSLLGIDLDKKRVGLGANLLSTPRHCVILNNGSCVGDTSGSGGTEHLQKLLELSNAIICGSFYGRSH